MDAVMWAALLAVAGVAAGAVLGAFAMWVDQRGKARKLERAARESVADLGWLMERQRAEHETTTRVLVKHANGLAQRAGALEEECHDARMAAVWADLARQVDVEQAQAATLTALAGYGRQVERADLAEQELAHEQWINEGLVRVAGGAS